MLGKAYAVLADKDQRAVYDEQGIVDEESDTLDQDRNWEEHWRRLFPKVFFFEPCLFFKILVFPKVVAKINNVSALDHIARHLGL